MTLAHQPSMWDLAEEATLSPLTGSVVRHELSRGAWVDHLPGWVSGSDEVLEVLLGDIGWREDRRQMYEREVAVPRLLRWYGGGETLPHPLLTEARDGAQPPLRPGTRRAIRQRGYVPVPRRPRQRRLARRPDRPRPLAPTRWSRSSRSVRRGRCCSARSGAAESLRFPLGHGDLVVMGGSCQRTWEHCIPKTAKPVGPRVSVQFRPRGVA